MLFNMTLDLTLNMTLNMTYDMIIDMAFNMTSNMTLEITLVIRNDVRHAHLTFYEIRNHKMMHWPKSNPTKAMVYCLVSHLFW